MVIKWTEAFADFLNRVIGTRTIPLSYVIRDDEAVPAPALATNQPYGAEFSSVEVELIARASHGHALFRDDNTKVYYYLEEATRTTYMPPQSSHFDVRKMATEHGRRWYPSMQGRTSGVWS